MRILMAVVLVWMVSLGPPAWAQERYSSATLQSAAVATGDGTVMNVSTFSSVGVTVTIATTATVTFEVSQDGANWASRACTSVAATNGALVTTATATGTFQCPIAGMQYFRARISAWTAGAVTVKATATTAPMAKFGGAGGGAPSDATYLVVSADGTLSAEVAVGATDDATLVGNGTTIEAKVLPSCSNATTSKLLYNSTTNAFSCGTDQDSGAGSGMTHPQVMARASIGF